MSELVQTDNGFTFRAGTADEWILREVRTGYKRLLNAIEPGDVVLDAGGYIGTFAAMAAQRGARVVSYEPDLANFEVLQINSKRYDFQAVPAALIAYDARSVSFWKPLGDVQLPYGSLLKKNRNYAQAAVPAINISEVQKKLRPRWVKVDVEGVECDLIRALDWSNIDGLAVEYDLRREGQREEAENVDEQLRATGFVCKTRKVSDHSIKLRSTVKTYIKE